MGEIASGRAAIDQALERCHRDEELWYLPELLRIKGEILLREGGSDAVAAAETQFLQSLDYRFRESCHKQGIHLSFQAPMCAGALRTKD